MTHAGNDDFTTPWKAMDKKELETEYSPSMWSKRFSADEIINVHVKVTRDKSQEVQKSTPCRKDIPYANKGQTKLDVFGEDLPKESYILAYVHGGYWQDLGKDISSYPATSLYKNGILTVILGYTLAPEAQLAQIVEEVRMGLAWVCRLAKERSSKGVILMGHSAGGHLISQVLSTTEDKENDLRITIRGLISLAGIFDLRPLVGTYVNDPLKLEEKSALELSPFIHVKSLASNFAQLKAFIVVGEEDSPEFRRQSRQYQELLTKHNIDASYLEIKEADHFKLVEDLSYSKYILIKRIKEFIVSL